MHSTKIVFLQNDSQIEANADSLLAATALGLDTEFVRERTYLPIPGLLQIGNGETVWLLDFEVLQLLGGSLPRPLFDTQIAAALIGQPLQLRYETLAHELLGLEFPGGLGRNDWTRRPLPEAWIEYACNDVIGLPAMRDELSERLDRLGRLDWLAQECERALARFDSQDLPVLRVKGAAGLDDDALERAARLASWREARARERDLPRGFIAGDPLLLELARRPATNIVEFSRATPPHRIPGAALRAEMLDIVQAEPIAFERPPELVPLTPDQRARIKALQGWVRKRAEELQLEPAVLASRRDLTRLVQGADSDCLHGWRGQILAGIPF
jgi:ribonuclease D